MSDEPSSIESTSTEPTEIEKYELEKNDKALLDILPKKPEKPNEKISNTQKVKDKINEKLNSGFELNDKNSKLELNKLVRDELHLAKGWSSDINKAVKEIAIERKITISDLGFKNDKIGDVTVNLVKNETSTETLEIQSNVSKSNSPLGALPKNTAQSSHGALPKTGSQQTETRTDQSEEPEKKYMSETAQKKLISHGLTKMILPLYTAMGIIELDEDEKKEEAKLPKGQQVKKDFEELATELDEYLTENNIRLPAFLNHISILISIIAVLVLPVIKFKMFSTTQTAKPDYDESADNVEVKT